MELIKEELMNQLKAIETVEVTLNGKLENSRELVARIKMGLNLVCACEETGGSPFETLEEMRSATVGELIDILGPNKIGFINLRDEKPKPLMAKLNRKIRKKERPVFPSTNEPDSWDDFDDEDDSF